MRSRHSTATALIMQLCCTLTPVMAQTSGLRTMVYKGCYTSAGGMADLGSYTFQTQGYCQAQCVTHNKPVMGTSKGSNCWCGDLLPDSNSKASDSECSSPCDGYDKDMCGGPNAWSVQLTGTNNNVGSEQSTAQDSNNESNLDSNSNPNPGSDLNPNSKAAASSSLPTLQPTPAQREPPSVVTKASTIVVTAPGETSPQQTIITTTETPPPSGGPNKAGVAAGVVGIVALSAIAGGIFFFLRNRKKRAIEEEYRHNMADTYGPKPPPSSAGSTSDSRLEPSVMMRRRQSDASIADNQDYSRRILKITNPDGT